MTYGAKARMTLAGHPSQMRVNVVKRDPFGQHHDLYVVEQLTKFFGGTGIALILRSHPCLGGLFNDLLADRVHASVELGDSARALGAIGRLVRQLGEQLIKSFHRAQTIGSLDRQILESFKLCPVSGDALAPGLTRLRTNDAGFDSLHRPNPSSSGRIDRVEDDWAVRRGDR